MSFCIEKRTSCVSWYTETKSIITTQRKFRQKYGKNERAPSHGSIVKWLKKFQATGTVQAHQINRTPIVNHASVIDHFQDNPKSSLRRAANTLNICHTSVHRILKKYKYHPYKIKIVQQLNGNDFAARIAFAEEMLYKIEDSNDYLRHLMFSDEAHFHLHGGVNKHNCRYWASINPHWYSEKPLHSDRTTVWAAIWHGGVIGPFFFDDNVNGENYLALLQTDFWPAFSMLPHSNRIVFMQDGAPPHWSRMVRNWLNEMLPNKWMGRGTEEDSNIKWPARSPDLTPCDFFLWGFIKSRVYQTDPVNLNELKERIRQAFTEVTPEMLENTFNSFKTRLNIVIQNDGRQTEV